MRHDPHTLLEGCLVAGAAMGARAGRFYYCLPFIICIFISFSIFVCNNKFNKIWTNILPDNKNMGVVLMTKLIRLG